MRDTDIDFVNLRTISRADSYSYYFVIFLFCFSYMSPQSLFTFGYKNTKNGMRRK